MALFELSDITQGTVEQKISGFAEVNRFYARNESLVIVNRQALENAFGAIKKGDNIFFVNLGRWSAHDIIFYLLQHTGPAEFYFTGWAISEKAARLIQSAVDEQLITAVHAVLDRRIEIRNAKVIATVRNFCTRLVFVDCHAKLFVLRNKEWAVTLLSTANLSNNLRIEAGHIYTDSLVADMVIKTIDDIIINQKPFQ